MTLSAEDTKIKIPDKHYIGFSKRGDDEVPLGFMTPDGTDSAAIKRKATVDSWAANNRHRYNPATRQHEEVPQLPARSVDNRPMSGFKLGRDVRHGGYGWGQGNVKWRIEDPRGFELEITSPNLAKILLTCTVEQGEILDQCVWARKGADNVLLPVNSDIYVAAQANTARIKMAESSDSVKVKDCQPGDSLVLANGEGGVYLGRVYRITKNNYAGLHGNTAVVQCEGKPVFALIQTSTTGERTLYLVATLRPAARTPGTLLTPNDIERMLAEFREDDDIGRVRSAGTSYGSNSIVGFTCEPIASNSVTYGLREVEFSEIDTTASRQHYLAQLSTGELYTNGLGYYYGQGMGPVPPLHERLALVFRDQLIQQRQLVGQQRNTTVGSGYFVSRHDVPILLDISTVDPTVKWYLYEAQYATSTGVAVSVPL